jgi:hypothetical protein
MALQMSDHPGECESSSRITTVEHPSSVKQPTNETRFDSPATLDYGKHLDIAT